MRDKLLVALQLEVPHHFIEKFTRGRSPKNQTARSFRASKTAKTRLFEPCKRTALTGF
jgi:hypothetical protein